ncbi:MAG: four helix bundle protein [Lentimicrobiaceae bacterium]|nr:four helix bundle protein [Lentimicrobiaceae bacterium]
MTPEDNKSTTFFRFEDLRVYNKAIGFISLLTETSTLATNEIEIHYYKRFLEEATLLAFNIAEGSSKNKPSFIAQLKAAKTNIRKCVVFCAIGKQNTFLSEENENLIRTQLMELTKMIGALIVSLQRSVNSDHHDHYLHETQESASFEEEMIW